MRQKQKTTRLSDIVKATAFLVFWLVPVFYHALTHDNLYQWLPIRLWGHFHVTCLFTTDPSRWEEFYVQGTTDEKHWFTLKDSEYTPMQPFGYVNRHWQMMHWFTELEDMREWLEKTPDTPASRRGIRVRQLFYHNRTRLADEFAAWYRDRYTEKHPNQPRLSGIRFLAVHYPVGGEIAEPEGAWARREVEEIPTERIQVAFRRSFGAN